MIDTTGPAWKELQEATRKLPPYPFPLGGDTVCSLYKESLGSCSGPSDLQAHTERWKYLWTINLRFPGELLDHEKALFTGSYDPDKVWEHLEFLQTWAYPEGDLEWDLQMQVALDVKLPKLLAELSLLGRYFGVPRNAVLVQAANLTELT